MNSTICPSCRQALRHTLRNQRRSHQATASHSTAASTATLSRPSRPQPPTPAPTTTSTSQLADLLQRPSWSVRTLLPPDNNPHPPSTTSTTTTTTIIPATTLHHLLRLSALPQPRSPAEESRMLSTLGAQLGFVRAVRAVDTAGVAPLRAVRDETAAGLREQTVGLAELRGALDAEDIVGHGRRPRRRPRWPQPQPQPQSQSQSQSRLRQTQEQEQEQEQDRQQQQSRLPGEGGGVVAGRRHAQEGRDGATGQEERARNEEEDWDVLGGASEIAGGRYFVVRSAGTNSSSPNGTVG
ncbi:putative a-agglutinin core protein AGA1 [Rosellinia necatrix]|uniref:Putative a-agglutinin core protein AGA1 n=1 Tax=Rosellinia necatrix TaxID=77044 RepID=A0A1W2TL41_ROSNE|nr:putative a-agglutinin core protein AGA1 [Rosellinia necatrix]